MSAAAPLAVYRLQLRNGVGFADAAAHVPYLAELGVSHLHLSPPFTACEGSTHGYDVADPTALDPALGSEAGFDELCGALRCHGLRLILDIVPNHMGIGADNAWWCDVLAKGAASPHAAVFDTDLGRDADGRLVLPVLGGPAEEAIAAGDLRLSDDGRSLAYFDRRFPLAEGSAAAGDVAQVLAAQHYRLLPWRDGASRNYRRFFDVDGLVGVRVEDPAVFEATHRLILDLVARHLVHGLRVDHVDGLRDPAGYLRRLDARAADAAGERIPIWVEKILVGDEKLPADWPVAGTTGYEFAATAGRILLAGKGLGTLERLRQRCDPDSGDLHAIEAAAKRQVLKQLFPGELAALVQEAAGLLGRPQVAVREALEALVAAFAVYRTYLVDGEPGDADRRVLAHALDEAAGHVGEAAAKVLDEIGSLLDGPLEAGAAALAARLQQLTGPVMAKSVEDTAFYRFPRLLALNEVGGDPAAGPLTDEEAHRILSERGTAWPMAMLATSTHDTKRGEDARARLLVLAEAPALWAEGVERWSRLNAGRSPALHAADELSFYQAMFGAWPASLAPGDAEGVAQLRQRLLGWQRKSLREAKLRTSWLEPDEAYEAAAEDFLTAALDAGRSPQFLDDFADMVARLAAAGAANGLAQTLLKLTAPGVPDIYQGAEGWDLSLVDPDNRRPVDWPGLRRWLEAGPRLDELAADWRSGAVKQALVRRVLAWRRRHAALFAHGRYLPLQVDGPAEAHAFAFARLHGDEVAITVVGRRLAGLIEEGTLHVARDTWAGSSLILPDEIAGRAYRDIIGGAELAPDGHKVALATALARLPVALLGGAA